MSFEMKKVFDCQKMPKEVKKFFFDRYGEGKSNDVYINVCVEGDCHQDTCYNNWNCDNCPHREYNIVEKWLMDNGASDDYDVIVKRWW